MVTIVTRRGPVIEAVAGFHDGTTLVYEQWDTHWQVPSGHFGAIPLEDIERVIVP